MGVEGKIINFPFQDLEETIYDKSGITIKIKDGILYIEVDEIAKIEEGKSIANLYIAQWTFRNNVKLSIQYNTEWKLDQGGIKGYFLEVEDPLEIIDRVITTTQNIQGKAMIVTQEMYDSASFANDSVMVDKVQKYPILQSVINYYSQEVIGDDRPLYGIYKAIEAITDYLGTRKTDGRSKLAQLINQPPSYVDDIMQTSQLTRHHKTMATQKITDEECRQRTKKLIAAFADLLPL